MLATVQRILTSVLFVCMLLLVAACSGGSVKPPEIANITGKGAAPGSPVEIRVLTPQGTPGELLGSSVAASDGSYVVQIPRTSLGTQVVISTTGTAGVPLRGVIGSVGDTQTYGVTLLTEAAYQQIQRLVTEHPDIKVTPSIIAGIQSRIGTIFSVDDITPPPVSGTPYAAVLAVFDQMAASGGTVSQTLTLLNQALADVTGRPYAIFRDQFMQAATAVATADPALTTLLTAIRSGLLTPPPEPVWNDSTPPNPVTNLRGIGGADTATTCVVTLLWSPATTGGSNPVVGYEISRDGVRIATVTSTTFVDRPLIPETTYAFSVIAVDAAGNRSSGVSLSVTTPRLPNLTIDAGGQLTTDVLNRPYKDIFPPAAPFGITATVTVIDQSASSVNLTWQVPADDTGVVSYDVYRDGVKLATVTTTGYTDPLVTSGVSHTYLIYALDAAGNRSQPSAPVTVTPLAGNLVITVGGQLSTSLMNLPYKDITPPAAPSGISATTSAVNATTSTVSLSWQIPSDDVGVVSYDVYRDGVKLATVTTTGYTDPSVTSGVSHTYLIYALDAAGNRSPQGSITITPVSPNLTINAGGAVSP